jgi:acyl dehydratase
MASGGGPGSDRPRGFDPETLEAAGFPTISIDRLTVGEEFRSDDRLLRPQDVVAYAFAVDDHDELFFEPSLLEVPLVHPTLLANQALFLRHNRYTVPAGLHARMAFEFVAPVPLGIRARTAGRLLETYHRRGKPYMVTGFTTRADDGTVLVRGRFVQMLFAADTAPPPGSSAPRPEPAPPALDPAITAAIGRAGELRIGQVLGPLSRTISQRQIDVYSGVRPGSIHTDPAWAEAKGFATTIAQGMMTTAYTSTLMTEALGLGFVVGGGMDVRFLRPVLCGDTLTVDGTIDGFSPGEGGVSVHVTVRAVNQRGDTTMAGTARGRAGAVPGS